MGYIITQSEDDTVKDLDSIDAMIDQEEEKLYIFQEYEDAVSDVSWYS